MKLKTAGSALLVAACLLSCGRQDPPVANALPTVIVIRPVRADAVDSITLPGDLVGYYEAALHAKVTGYLKRISVDKGDWVKAGQVLAEIEVPELQQRLDRARASLQVERVTYERIKRVWDSDHRLVARQDVDVAYGNLLEAKAEVEELETMVGYTRIIAPFEGVVTGRFVDPGALIRAGGDRIGAAAQGAQPEDTSAPVVTVARIDKLRVYLYVPEREVGLVRRGMPVTLSLHEFPGRTFTGKVARFATSLDLSTRTMLTEVDVANPQRELYPGMYADVCLELARHPGALELPPTAIGAEQDSSFVYVVKDGRLAKVEISTGINTGREVEITAGLRGTEQIVSSITPALREGKKVNAVILQPNLLKKEGRFAELGQSNENE